VNLKINISWYHDGFVVAAVTETEQIGSDEEKSSCSNEGGSKLDLHIQYSH
jgi:hypothetical protein